METSSISLDFTLTTDALLQLVEEIRHVRASLRELRPALFAEQIPGSVRCSALRTELTVSASLKGRQANTPTRKQGINAGPDCCKQEDYGQAKTYLVIDLDSSATLPEDVPIDLRLQGTQ